MSKADLIYFIIVIAFLTLIIGAYNESLEKVELRTSFCEENNLELEEKSCVEIKGNTKYFYPIICENQKCYFEKREGEKE